MDSEAILEIAPIPVWIQREEEIIRVNEEAIRYFGANSASEVIGGSALSYVPEEFQDRVLRRNRQVLDEKISLDALEGRTLAQDGSIKHGHFAIAPVTYDDEPAILVMTQDITERVERERKLMEQQERLNLAVEGAELGVWDWDMQTDTVTRNERYARMLGYEPETLNNTHAAWEDILHPEDYDRYTQALERHIDGEADLYEIEYRLAMKGGDWKWVRNIGKVVEWDDEKPIRAVGIHQDIDGQKRMRRKLRQNTELLTNIDRVLRHNLQNEMNVIEGFTGKIQEASSGKIEDHAERVLESSEALMETVEKEQAITNFLADPKAVEKLDVVATIEASVSYLSSQYPKAEIKTDLPASCEASARREIGQAIEELIENAIIHSDRDNPEVDVEAEQDDEMIEIRVVDNGPKIPEMEQKVLTEEAEITPLYHGSGLGLWLVNLIVRQSEGELSFTPREPRGNIVTVRLPCM